MALPRRDLRSLTETFDFDAFERIRCAPDGGKRFAEVLFPFVKIFVRGEAARQGHSSALADDVSQEVIVDVWRHRMTVTFPDPAHLFAWLWRVSHNAVVDARRHRQRSRSTESAWEGTFRVGVAGDSGGRGHGPVEDQILVVEDDPTRMAMARERGKATAHAIHQLPPRERSILVRWIFHDDDLAAIAYRCGISARSASRGLNAAFGSLERALRRFESDPER